MMRQLGIFIWFCFFLVVEMKWIFFLKILGKFIDNVIYIEDDINNFFWDEKCRFIKLDLVICLRYFDYRFQRFFYGVLLYKIYFVGEVVDYFFCVEF